MVGARTLSPVMPTTLFRGMSDGDLSDIFAYLKTLMPVHHRLTTACRPRTASFAVRNMAPAIKTEFDSLRYRVFSLAALGTLDRSPEGGIFILFSPRSVQRPEGSRSVFVVTRDHAFPCSSPP